MNTQGRCIAKKSVTSIKILGRWENISQSVRKKGLTRTQTQTTGFNKECEGHILVVSWLRLSVESLILETHRVGRNISNLFMSLYPSKSDMAPLKL